MHNTTTTIFMFEQQDLQKMEHAYGIAVDTLLSMYQDNIFPNRGYQLLSNSLSTTLELVESTEPSDHYFKCIVQQELTPGSDPNKIRVSYTEQNIGNSVLVEILQLINNIITQ